MKVVDLRTRNPTTFSLYFSDFYMIYFDFSNVSAKLLQKNPSQHYSFESIAMQIAPWTCSNSCTRSLGGNKTEEAHREGGVGRFRRGGSPAASGKLGES